MAEAYYFVSDLHVGGDEQLQECEFEAEFIGFLQTLESTDEDAELIILGDAFGLWEFTETDGIQKFDELVDHHPKLFEQFRKTGENVTITLIPGNHDAELAGYSEYIKRLREFNVELDPTLSLERTVADRTIWIEHGMQQDSHNRMPEFGNPRANPLGYFVNRHITSKAGQLSGRGRYNWLKDIQSLTPLEEIPDWIASNYFYREMSPFLRYAALPFLLLFNVSLLYLVVLIVGDSGLFGANAATKATGEILRDLGFVGSLIEFVFLVNLVVVSLLFVISIPLYFFARDVRKTLERFDLVRSEKPTESPDKTYVEAAKRVFRERPDVAAYIYGHTHRVSLTNVGERVIINTGTWLKRLHRTPTWIGLLPPVYYPSFRLNYFRICEEDGDVLVEYHTIQKEAPKELTLLQRLLSRKPKSDPKIPERTVIGGSKREVVESASKE
ncbi:metallophosphoesterase [Haladaptatus caseinilyticus]|uniref:metallophosphoesterase n=1 Tax=Haladaptatus caseinilyticus TaxID=2993314 RepID=UPI00224B72BC|nr:metallophosphoesterase [Haladaptatus caseinilyticus]